MKYKIILSSLFAGVSIFIQAQNNEAMLDTTSHKRSLYESIAGDKAKTLSAHMNFHFCTTGTADFEDFSMTETKFRMRRLRMEIYGSFAPKFSYHFRQSFNHETKPGIEDNIASSVELAFVKWSPSPKFSLTTGKQFMALSGYECWVNGVKVREFSDFNNTLSPCQVGIAGTYHFNPNHEVTLQVVNNRSNKDEDTYAYGLPVGVEKSKVPLTATANWIGYFLDRALMLQYSASLGKMAKGHNVTYLTCGNVWERGPILAYLDFMYSREGLDSKGLISNIPTINEEGKGVTAQYAEYFTTIANFDYRFHPRWNAFVKGVFETGGIYRTNNMYEKGLYKKTWNAQVCLEYLPLKEDSNLRFYLHLLYKQQLLTEKARTLGAASNNIQRITLGLVYTIPVF